MARQASKEGSTTDESVFLPLPEKSESHRTRYRTVPRFGRMMVLLAPGQIEDTVGVFAEEGAEEEAGVEVVAELELEEAVGVGGDDMMELPGTDDAKGLVAAVEMAGGTSREANGTR